MKSVLYLSCILLLMSFKSDSGAFTGSNLERIQEDLRSRKVNEIELLRKCQIESKFELEKIKCSFSGYRLSEGVLVGLIFSSESIDAEAKLSDSTIQLAMDRIKILLIERQYEVYKKSLETEVFNNILKDEKKPKK